MHDQQKQFNACAEKLAESLPASLPENRAAGGILGKILALVNALKAGDLLAILKAVYDVLGEFVADDTTNFGAPVAGMGMDLKSLLGILAMILGLLAKK